MRRKSTEIILSICAVAAVLLVLLSYDDRFRQEFSLRVDRGPTAQASEVAYTARKLGGTVVQAAKDHGLGYTPVLIFVVAGSVLLLFMTRT